MNFYLILPSYDVNLDLEAGQLVRTISGATLYHVFPSLDNKSYNLYVLVEYINWPKKRISRKFIEIHFKCQMFYKSIPGKTVRELVENMNCENYILVQ
jgi:hypothetical protein